MHLHERGCKCIHLTVLFCAGPRTRPLVSPLRGASHYRLKLSPEPVTRPWPRPAGPVGGVGQRAAVDRQAAAADAGRQALAQALEFRDALVDTFGPFARQ